MCYIVSLFCDFTIFKQIKSSLLWDLSSGGHVFSGYVVSRLTLVLVIGAVGDFLACVSDGSFASAP